MSAKGHQHLIRNDLNAQIVRMVAFIQHEATERAEEIDSKTDGECCYEKARLIHQARLEFQKGFEKRERQVLKNEQSEKATMENQARLRLLACREAHIARVEAEVQQRLVEKMQDVTAYREVLYKLLVQGVVRLLEVKVLVRVREQDTGLIEELIPRAVDFYTKEVGSKLRLSVDSSKYLPPSCMGGVELASHNRRLRVTNTLQSRTQMIVRQLVPTIKQLLFDSS